jgi:hypothetical protein
MRRVRHKDTPEYAVDIIDGARPIGSQLGVAAGLLTAVLIALSAMEAPMRRPDLQVARAGGMETPSPDEPGLLCSIGGKIVSWIAVEAS